MLLFHTSTSPFVRKVLVAAHELGLADRIETHFLRPSPLEPSAELSQHNPLSKIPTLVLDDGQVLYDSRVICEYLDTLATGRRLVAAEGPARWRTLRQQALCDGMLDAAIVVFYEKANRPASHWYAPWLDGQSAKVLQGLDQMEKEIGELPEEVDLAQVALGAALGWFVHRGVVGDVLASRPQLAAWYARFSERPSMVATRPPSS